jgi:fatty-acyl-CoA synthase
MPKLAAHTHRNQVTDAWMIALGGPLNHDSALFAALPLFHANAMMVMLLAPLLRGQHVVWAGPLGYRDGPLFGCSGRSSSGTASPPCPRYPPSTPR